MEVHLTREARALHFVYYCYHLFHQEGVKRRERRRDTDKERRDKKPQKHRTDNLIMKKELESRWIQEAHDRKTRSKIDSA